MQIRNAIPADADSIMHIFRQAQASLHNQGVNQWQNGYPNPEIVDRDIASGNGLVCITNSLICAAFVLSFDCEDTYYNIFKGQWLSTGQYGVIHRMAIGDAFKGQGLGTVMISHAEQICLSRGTHSIKVDTHRDNILMQSLLGKNQFCRCGIIYLEDGQERLAFEKLF